MKYIFIEEEAIKNLIESRVYQSAEYEPANTVLDFLQNGKISSLLDLQFAIHKDIGYVFGKHKVSLKKAIIFDLNQFTAFNSKDRDEVITIFQKILRFSIKYWYNYPKSTSEHFLEDSHAVVFPFPLTGAESYRVLINLCPDSKHAEKRGLKYLIVSKDGYTFLEDSKMSIPFKRIKDDSLEICIPVTTEKLTPSKIDAFEVHETDEIGKKVVAEVGYETWQYLLTDNQKRFIEKDISGPERLEGAAGTGKTLSLILRVVYNIKNRVLESGDYNIIFFAHSIATKKQIENIFISNYPDIVDHTDRSHSPVSLEITTLQEWCGKSLEGRIRSTEYLDIDAQYSKELQLMYLDEAFSECLNEDYNSYKVFCSESFINYITNNEKEVILEMIQSEIAISIKGRAAQDIERYRGLERLEGSIPMEVDGDYNFIFLIYEKYQQRLSTVGSFDSDDVILSSIGQLNTPLWRRRRNIEGYDAIFIDETHLFNYNELNVFHFLSKDKSPNIIFAIDKTQAIGDWGYTHSNIFDKLNVKSKDKNEKYHTVFRSSPDIVNCAFHILNSGVNLFTTFENPLERVSYSFTAEEEKKCLVPTYYLKENDEQIIHDALKLAEEYSAQYKITRHKILIVATSSNLLNDLKKYAIDNNKPYESLQQRGDVETIKTAEEKNRYILGLIDYVGGLEFDAVIIIGVDKDRVPPLGDGTEGQLFQLYTWHNRMYVAVSRAKYILTLMGEKSRGVSSVLSNAIQNKAITLVND